MLYLAELNTLNCDSFLHIFLLSGCIYSLYMHRLNHAEVVTQWGSLLHYARA